jgi:hypothetical protein
VRSTKAVERRYEVGDHVCVPVTGAARREPLLASFAADGLRASQKIIFFTDDPPPDRLAAALSRRLPARRRWSRRRVPLRSGPVRPRRVATDRGGAPVDVPPGRHHARIRTAVGVDGREYQVDPATAWDSDHPPVLARPELFTPVPAHERVPPEQAPDKRRKK